MTAWVIGQNCHIILSHPDIDAGAEYGFILNKDDSIREQGVQFKREVVTNTVTLIPSTNLWIYFNILLGDAVINPNGARRGIDRETDYLKLLEFLDKTDGIAITTYVGTFPSVGSVGWSADERHLHDHSIIYCNLNNIGYYYPPVDPELLLLSVWDGTLTWETSYWR
jgi:hypothetical protein